MIQRLIVKYRDLKPSQQFLADLIYRGEILEFGEFTSASGKLIPYKFSFTVKPGQNRKQESLDKIAQVILPDFLPKCSLTSWYCGLPTMGRVLINDFLKTKPQCYKHQALRLKKRVNKCGKCTGFFFEDLPKWSGAPREVIVFDDVLSEGTRVLQAKETLVGHNYQIIGAYFLLNRLQYGSKRLRSEQIYPIHSYINLLEFLACAYKHNYLPTSRILEIYRYWEDNWPA